MYKTSKILAFGLLAACEPEPDNVEVRTGGTTVIAAQTVLRAQVILGEEKGDSRVLRKGVLQPAGTLYAKGDHVVTRHVVRVTTVKKGDSALTGKDLDVWVLGGTVPVDDTVQVTSDYFHGGYLIEKHYYEIDLDPLPTVETGPGTYFVHPGPDRPKYLAPPSQGPGLPPDDDLDKKPPSQIPPICQPGFSGFASFEDAIDFAAMGGHGRLPDYNLDHTFVQYNNIWACYGERYYRLLENYVVDLDLATYVNPYWSAEAVEACQGAALETIKRKFRSVFSLSPNPYVDCKPSGGLDFNNLADARVIVAGCGYQDCEPTVDDCDVYGRDEVNCIGLGDAGPGAQARVNMFHVYDSDYGGDYEVREAREFDLIFSSTTNFDLSHYGAGGYLCASAPESQATPENFEYLKDKGDFEQVFTHEMGHAMGLGHVPNFDAMMFGGYNLHRYITCHDTARLAVLYPRASCSEDGYGWPCSCGLAGQTVEGVQCLAGN